MNNPEFLDLNVVLEQSSFVKSLSDFLHKNDDTDALQFCIEEFVDPSKYHSNSAVKNALLLVIAEIDTLINEQLNAIIHHKRFQKIEASWRGLWLLVKQAEGSRDVKIKVLDISWREVAKDISRSLEFDQSQLFQKIYSNEYGSPGGEPYGAIIGDYEVSHKINSEYKTDDAYTLAGIAQIMAAAFSPFITSASPELFGMEDFSDLGRPINLDYIFSQEQYTKWKSLREGTDSRFIGITLPRVLMRRPYQDINTKNKVINFSENEDGNSNNNLWGNACYAFGCILIREFIDIGWFGHIRGAPRNQLSGGIIKEFSIDYHKTDADGVAFKPVTDVTITDDLEKRISELGFVPLCQGYLSPYATFYNNQSIHAPKSYSAMTAHTNARISSMLQHVLCGSRISHFIKVMVRDKVGSFISAEKCEEYIANWLMKYTTGTEDLDWEEQARYPLKSGSVQVKEHPNKLGEFLCVIHIQPHYQLDQMVSELKLVTELKAFRK